MTTPNVLDVTETALPTGASPQLINMPATIEANDLLAMFLSGFGNGTISKPTDWTEKWNVNPNPRSACFVLQPTEAQAAALAGGTVSIGLGGTPEVTAQVYRIDWKTWARDLSKVLAGTPANGSSNQPDPPLVEGGVDLINLFIAAASYVDDDETVSAYPTNYGNGTLTLCGAAANHNATTATALRNFRAASDDPGAFTLSGSEGWIAGTLLVPAFPIAALMVAMEVSGPR
jgi:hypothetical protein